MSRNAIQKERGWKLESSTAIGILLLIKPVVDMLWFVAFLDYVLLIIAFFLFLRATYKSDFKLAASDMIVFALLTMLSISFLQELNGFVVYVKIASALLLFFIGRAYYSDFHYVIGSMKIGFGIVVVMNFVMLMLGQGFQALGTVNTFVGMYYFKADLACAMSLSILVFLFWGNNKKIDIPILVAATLMLFLSNTRAYYIVIGLVCALFVLYKRKHHLGLRTVLIFLAVAIVVMLALNLLSHTALFSKLGFISFRFDSFDELFNGENTQGRNQIWSFIIDKIGNGDLLQKLFGFDLVHDEALLGDTAFKSHSMYIGMLYNIGIVGVALFIALIVIVAVKSARVANPTFSYFIWALLIQFSVSGISVNILQYTSSSWVPMFMFGVALSISDVRGDSCSKPQLNLDSER